ncbi:MAG: hypothetical protein KH208_03780 [Desulfovibrio sp.]|uniref:hypothetical protein n=1 Tax=Desulfovibrio sp. TaxID=885 RepID=UPI0025C1E2DE|nr:hypothetical protein [Desulfovibrio sp.]MBS6828981.1 hypothetical protein [Desulfovibrio sp.]
MRRILAVFLLWAATVIPQTSQAAVAALSGHAPLRAASLYTGGEHAGGGEQRVELYLLDGNFFVLRQIAAPRGKKAVTRDMTGFWRQVDDGFPHSLALKKSPFRKPSFSVMGRLDRIAGRAALTDSATGRVFAPAEGEALAALPGKDSLFVDAVILPAKNGCAVQRIRSFSTRFPSQAGSAPTDGDFAARVAGEVWLLPSLPGLPAASCVFSERGKGQGALEVTGPGLRLTADYVLRGPGLTFSVRKEDARMLEACGAEVLPRMLASVRSWSLEGGALTLTSADGQSFLLEKAAPDRRAGSGRAAAPKGYKR